MLKLFNCFIQQYTFEASSTLVKEANVGRKNKSLTGNTGQCQNSAEHHFTGEYILQFYIDNSFTEEKKKPCL